MTTTPSRAQPLLVLLLVGVGLELVAAGGSSSSTDDSAHHPTAHFAILWGFLSLFIGILIQYCITRFAPVVPYTAALFVVFTVLGGVHEVVSKANGTTAEADASVLSTSIEMWVNMDPHLLLFVFLPALLFGDSMGLNWHLVKRCFWQCMTLAIVGTVIGTTLTALCAKFIGPLFGYEWSWPLCFMFGSILAATDPVAVVSLLKDVGASPILTMQIAGESMFNDGVAIVAFSVFYGLEIGTILPEEGAAQGLKMFAQMFFVGILWGILMGVTTWFVMSKTDRQTGHADVTMQIATTFCCAYLSYFVGEQIFKASGVLSSVFSGLFLAYLVWPHVVSREAMENVWHTIEFIGNTLIFMMAGMIWGSVIAKAVEFGDRAGTASTSASAPASASHHLRALLGSSSGNATGGNASLIPPADPIPTYCNTTTGLGTTTLQGKDAGYLVLLFVLCLLIRAFMIACLYPCLKRMGYGFTHGIRDAAFMAWGGLRGAVGLALAMLFYNARNGEANCEMRLQATHVVFQVGGIAFLTLVVCGMSGGAVLRALGLVEMSSEDKDLLGDIKYRIHHKAAEELIASFRGLRRRVDRAIRLDGDKTALKLLSPRRQGQGQGAEQQVEEENKFREGFWLEVLMDARAMVVGEFREDLESEAWKGRSNSTVERDNDALGDKGHVSRWLEACTKTGIDALGCQMLVEEITRELDEAAAAQQKEEKQSSSTTTTTTTTPTAAAAAGSNPAAAVNGGGGGALHTASMIDGVTRAGSVKSLVHGTGDSTQHAKMQSVRQLYCGIIKASYWEQIEEWILPDEDGMARLALESVDRAIDAIRKNNGRGEPEKTTVFPDFKLLEQGMRSVYHQGWNCAVSTLSCLAKCCCWQHQRGGCLNRSRMKLEFWRMETSYHLLMAYIEAHRTAEKLISEYIGADVTADTVEEQQVIAESNLAVETAKGRLVDLFFDEYKDQHMAKLFMTKQLATVAIQHKLAQIRDAEVRLQEKEG